MDNISILDAAVIASLGYGVVFFGIVLLMLVVVLVSKAFTAKKQPKKEEAAPAPSAQAVQPVVPAADPVAPGSAGQLKLHDVEPKVAAMLMAIVANKMDKPLNELRFISIKEVK